MDFGKWIGFIVFLLSVYILWQVRQLLLIIFTAVLIATALNIIIRRLERSGVKRGYAVLITVVTLLVVLAGFFWVIIPPFVEQLIELLELVPEGIAELNFWLVIVEERLDPRVLEFLPDIQQLTRQLQPLLEQLLGGGITIFSNSLATLLNLLLVTVLTLMIAADPISYRNGFVRLFPSFYRRRVDTILLRCEYALQGWLGGILFNMAVITILSFVGLSVLGIPLALSQALLAGLLRFIPNIGAILSVIPPIAIALLDEPWKALAVLILYIVIQQVDNNFLTPIVMAQQVSLLPAITLLAQVFFATFFGFLGLLLALPLTVVAQVWLREVLVEDILDNWGKTQEKAIEPVYTLATTAHTATSVNLPIEPTDGDGSVSEIEENREST